MGASHIMGTVRYIRFFVCIFVSNSLMTEILEKYAATISICGIWQISIVIYQTSRFRRAINSLGTMTWWCHMSSLRLLWGRTLTTETSFLGRQTCGLKSTKWCTLLWRRRKMPWSIGRVHSRCTGLIWSWMSNSGHGSLKWICLQLATNALTGSPRWSTIWP